MLFLGGTIFSSLAQIFYYSWIHSPHILVQKMFIDMDQSIPRFYCLFPTVSSKVGIGTEEALIKLLTWNNSAAAAAKSRQSGPTLCDPIDGSPPGSPIPGILQARTLEWVAISFSNAWKWKVKVKLLSRVWQLVTPWTAAYQAPPPMGFSRQENWSGVPLPPPEITINVFKLIF